MAKGSKEKEVPDEEANQKSINSKQPWCVTMMQYNARVMKMIKFSWEIWSFGSLKVTGMLMEIYVISKYPVVWTVKVLIQTLI